MSTPRSEHPWKGLKRAYRRYLNQNSLDQYMMAKVLRRALDENPPEFRRISGANFQK